MDTTLLPSVNAGLNTTSTLFLLLGYFAVRKRALGLHKATMLGACITSLLFLVSYLYYHYLHGSTGFEGQGMIRKVYFTILISHSILAALIVPMVIMTVVRAARGNFEKHKKIAKITLPLWLYVSVTGVIIYWMLYQVSWS